MAKPIKLTKAQMISIARAGYPDRVKQQINFKDVDIFYLSGVWRLYVKSKGLWCMLPSEDILTIHIEKKNWVQFGLKDGNPAFNHLAAIKKMYNLGIL